MIMTYFSVTTIIIDRNGLEGTVDLVGEGETEFGPEEGARVLARRPPRPDLAPDPDLPADYVPFNIQAIGDVLYVAYALPDSGRYDQSPGLGNGYVSVFDTDGVFLRRLVSAGPLNNPWGLAVAPGNFGEFSNALLVGNFADGSGVYSTNTPIWPEPTTRSRSSR